MKLSEIQALAPDAVATHYDGVEVDVPGLMPVPGIKSIGFLYSEGMDIEGELFDTLVQYARQANVMLEIPADVEILAPQFALPASDGVSRVARYLLSVSRNARFSITLLPPSPTDSPEVGERYKQRLADFTVAYLSSPNFNRFIYPISSFMEYLFMEHWGLSPENMSKLDPYMLSLFAEEVTPEYESDIKLMMRETIYAHFGGKDGFSTLATAMLRGLGKEVISMARNAGDDMATQMEENLRRDGFVKDEVTGLYRKSEFAPTPKWNVIPGEDFDPHAVVGGR